MSRSGYSDDCDGWALIRWRGAVKSAIGGKRGQAFLQEMLDALNALPKHELIAEDLEANGQYCALGAVGHKRGLDMSNVDAGDREAVAKMFDIAPAMAAEIVYENDRNYAGWDGNGWIGVTPEQRWTRMRNWITQQLKESK